MTLRQLHERIGQVMEQNAQHGYPERNDLPVVVETYLGRRRRHQHHYAGIRYVSDAVLGESCTVVAAYQPVDDYRAAPGLFDVKAEG